MSLSIRRPSEKAHGFTLIELMVALVIVGILTSMLLPVVGGAMRSARRSRVLNEIHLLETALTRFHRRYGVYPPSRIHLRESNNYASGGPMPTRTGQYLRHLWPSFPFDTPVDFNGDGDTLDTIQLNASECLVFFLGGMPMALVPDPNNPGSENLLSVVMPGPNFDKVTTRGLDGFCTNPRQPFLRSTDVNVAGTPIPGRELRIEPLFEFDPKRLSDVDADGFWEYYDPNHSPEPPGAFDPRVQPHPYVYFSSYEGEGYNFVILKNGQLTVTYDASWGPIGTPIGLRWPLSLTQVDLSNAVSIQWWQPRGYQILSPGLDGLIGDGTGAFGAAGGLAVLNPSSGAKTLSPEMLDDLTNVAGGELGKE